MSEKPRRLIDWLLWPFLALLTIGLAKPAPAVQKETEPTTTANAKLQVAEAEASEIKVEVEVEEQAAESTTAAIENHTSTSVHAIDPEKSKAFQLAARLSATAQLNRPKNIAQRAKKISANAKTPRWTRPIKVVTATKTSYSGSAKVIAFPKKKLNRRLDYAVAA